MAIIAGVLTAWVVSRAFGIGEIIDVVLIGVGALSVGWTVFVGIDHRYDFATGVYSGLRMTSNGASEHLAKVISILGVQAVLAVLSRGAKATRTGRGGRYNPQFAGSGVFPEAAALIHQGVVAGVAWEAKFQAGPAPVPTWALAQ